MRDMQSNNSQTQGMQPTSWHAMPGAGMDFLASLGEELRQGPLNLPCFPDLIPRVRQALDDPHSTIDDIVKIVGAEPRLSARLIQTASSVVFNPSGNPVPNLKVAINRLGHQLVQSVAMAFVIQQAKADPMLRPVAKPLQELWLKSMAVAMVCKFIARRIKVPADKVFLTGLMHGIGHFYIIVRSSASNSPLRYEQLQQDLVMQSHPALGLAVLRKWGFEDIVSNAVVYQHDYQRQSSQAADIVDVLIASIVMAEAVLYQDGDLSRTQEVTAFARLKLNAADLHAILNHTRHSLRSLQDALMAREPVDELAEERMAALERSEKSSRANEHATLLQTILPGAESLDRERQ
jgi:HD-like signal output (HDOD) protein